MEIKRSFLNSLECLFKDQAEALVESEGLTYLGVEWGVVLTQVVRPNTVICWLNDLNTVDVATAGDPGQVVEDT